MKIAFLFPLWSEEYGKISHFAKKTGKLPPMNLTYLAAISEKDGHEVRIIDGEAEEIGIPGMVSLMKEFSPDLIGITATTPFYHIAVNLANELKENVNSKIIIGGPHITVLKEEAFFDCFDFAFIGEADVSWLKFLKSYDKKEDPALIKGIIYRKNGKNYYTGQSESLMDINSLPIPARHLLKNEKYNIGTLEGIKRFTSITTVRGCPFNCIFCSTKVFGKDFRRRNPQLVIEEIKECVNKYRIEHFSFSDDTLTLNRDHIVEICRLIIKEDIKITFEGSTRANLVDEDLIKLMKDAGLIRISFGLESVDEKIRETMKKMVPLESYVIANKLTNKYRIETLNSCMIGLPGETLETIKKTLKFLRESKDIKEANISIAVPYPGTELYDMAKKGEMGLKLMTNDFSNFRRYNAAVMTVGDLTPENLIEIQNEAFASIYLAPWRWEPMIKRSGVKGAILTFNRLVKALKEGNTRFLTNKQLCVEEKD
jgi:radical SAM superfamily enzyme YgiQ (UPF0313 family)